MRTTIATALLLALSLGRAFPDASVPNLPPKIGERALAALLSDKSSNVRLLDVRTLQEFEEGYIPGAELFPYSDLRADFKESDKGRPIVVYCRSGRRSAIAKATLEEMGYTNVSDFGGYTNWTRGLAKK